MIGVNKALVYSTFLGGTRKPSGGIPDDMVTCVWVHPTSGDIYLAGKTLAADFPTTANAFQRNHSAGTTDYDVFFTILSSNRK